MHIDVIGQGPALVLIHGWALHGGVFAPLVERLSPHLQLHLVDLPGHGASRDDPTPLRLPHVVNAIAAATPPAAWCGWSPGGHFAPHAPPLLPPVPPLALTAAAERAAVPRLGGTATACGGFRFHDEMALLVRAGLSPAPVLPRATLAPARPAGKENEHSSVEVVIPQDLDLPAA